MKPAIIVLSIIGLVGLIGGIILYVTGTASILALCQNALSDQAQLNACVQQNATAGAGQILGGTVLFFLGLLCGFVAWILGIIKTVQVKAWGWFVLVLLISPLGSLIYGLAGPFQPKEAAMAAPSMYQPPYQQ